MNSIPSNMHYSPTPQYASKKSIADFFVTEKECTADSIGVAVVPDEKWDEFLAFCAEGAKEGKAAEMRASKEPGANRADLTTEQIKYLREKYNPHNMTQAEYSDFIRELVKFGILTDDHTPYLECPGVGKGYTEGWHSVGISGTYCGGLKFMGEPMSLADSNGDAMRWAKFESLFQKYDEDTRTFYLGRKALAFSKVYSAMEQISGRTSVSYSQTYQPERLCWDLKELRF